MAEPITIRITTDDAGLQEMKDLQEKLGTKTLATALLSAVRMMRQLYDYENDGYKLEAERSGEVKKFKLPSRRAAA